MKKTPLIHVHPLSVKVLLTILTLNLCGWTYDVLAQDTGKVTSTNTGPSTDKEPIIDADGNRIPWYLPLPDDEQTRSTVDMRFAPAEMKMVGPSPAAAGATKYSDYSVSYGLGLAHISIPVYEVKSHSLTLPISLSYDSGGIRVDDVSGPAGLGWTLEAGGVVTRTVMGLNDNGNFGWPSRPDGDPVSSSFQNETYLDGVSKGEQDSASDLYSFNFCGHSGSFYIDWKTYPWTVIPTSATDLDIEVSPYGFKITDTDGTEYNFSEQESSIRSTSVTLPYYGADGESYPQSTVPITAWYLTDIVAMNGTDTIKFYYTTYGSLYTSRHANTRSYQFTYRYNYPGNYLWYSTSQQWSGYPDVSALTGAYVTETSWTPKYLDYITFAGGRVDFEYKQNSESYSNLRRSYPWILDYISVVSLPPATPSETEVFRANFTLPFQGLDKRNLLTSLAFTGRNGTPIETYTLEYINAGTAMDTNSKDLFGYYNGANNSAGTAFLRLFPTDPFNETVANRNYNSAVVSNLSLETISTASGSKTRFQYEANSIYTSEPGVLFNTIGIGHRIKIISTYDLSGGSETLVRQREFTYSSPGITIPVSAFKISSFITLAEMFREDLTDGTPWWCSDVNVTPVPRMATVGLCDQSVLPGASLENARIYYGTVTERVSGTTSGSPSVRTDYVFDTSGAVHSHTGYNPIPETAQNAHDNDHDNNYPGIHSYHFFQRPPQYVSLNNYETSVDLSRAVFYFIPENFPQLTSPTAVRHYKYEGGTDKMVSQTTNEYAVNKDTLRVSIVIRKMIDLGNASNVANIHHCEDFYRAGINQKRTWFRLTSTTETEWLDDDSPQSAVTTYTYLPASSPSTAIPAVGATLSPKTRTTVYGGTNNTRTYTWTYMYPSEVAGGLPWAAQLVFLGYKKPFVESVTAGTGSGSSTSSRVITWATFTPPDNTGMTILRPSTISITRREPGSSTTNTVGPTAHYNVYDRHGNVLQVTQDNEKPVTYIWGYGGLRPVLEVTGGTYSEVSNAISTLLSSITDAAPTSQVLASARNSIESSTNPYMLVSWYQYDVPFGVSKASEVSGRLTQYEYDGAGRLTTVKDESGNRVNSYAYALNNGSNGLPNSISSVTHTTTGSSATAGVRDVAYFDGLGRTIQTVAAKASTSSGSSVRRDLVTPVVPDFLDREDAKAYIPYPESTSNANSGSYRSGALSAQQSYHGSGVRAYTENTYEISDRNRVIASSLPGFTETTTTQTNKSPVNTVLKLSYNPSTKKISANGYYDQGRFVQTVTEGPDGSRTEVYTDELGTPVLERVKLDASGTMADTYYVRDILGRVLCVVPPAEAAQLNSSTSNFSTANCYTYSYDGRDRVVKRQTPGGVEETITYNDMDLPVTRTRKPADGSSVNEVFTTEYDDFKRPTSETYKHGSNAAVTLAEYWYDSYPSGAPAFAAESGYVTAADTSSRTRGLKTAERLAMLPAGVAPSAMTSSNTSAKEFRALYYDAKGKLRQVARTNVLGGTDRISSSYDFAGNLLKERQKIQPGSGLSTHTLDRTYTYDNRLRVDTVKVSLDGGPIAIQRTSYDALQRTYKINRGPGTEVTTMTYTLQGWLSSASSASWEETLRYASPSKSATDSLPGKAGLVTEWVQKQKGTSSGGYSSANTFTYSYDKAGRLTGSLRYIGSSSSSVNKLTERNITYDRSGNLLTLDRYGASSGTTPTESLSYSYTGPKRNTWTYDAHANVTADPDGALSIAWNAIDLPRTLTTGTGTGASSTQRAYLADGTLAQVSDGTTTRLYLGDIVFDKASNGTVTLESAGWEGGRLLPGSGLDKVLYTVTDHLGSVRVVKDGAGAIRQRFDYYPYGTVSYVWTNSSTTDSSEKRYRFGGKEIAGSSLTDLAGTGAAPGAPYLDFGARLYSPRTATWLSPDPLMEKYYGVSPFVYCENSPVFLIDPDGEVPRVYVQINGIGHAFISTGEGVNTTIFTYGRYGNLYPISSGITLGPLNPYGEGVLGILSGQDAQDYLQMVYDEGNVDIYELPSGNEGAIENYFNDLFIKGHAVSNESKIKISGNPAYRVIDDYSLLKNNCVTTTISAIKAGGVDIADSSVVPILFNNFLSDQSASRDDLQIIYNPLQFIQSLLSDYYRDSFQLSK